MLVALRPHAVLMQSFGSSVSVSFPTWRELPNQSKLEAERSREREIDEDMDLEGVGKSGRICRHWLPEGVQSRLEYCRSWSQWSPRGSGKVLEGIGTRSGAFPEFWRVLEAAGSAYIGSQRAAGVV